MSSDWRSRMQTRFEEEVLSHRNVRAVLESFEGDDLKKVGSAAVSLLSSWYDLVQRRRALYSKGDPRTLPVGVQRYHTLLLQEMAKRNRSDIATLYGLVARLEVTGLNTVLSKFFIEHMLQPIPESTKELCTLNTSVVYDTRDQVIDFLAQHGLSKEAADWVSGGYDVMADETIVKVLKPGEGLIKPALLHQEEILYDWWPQGPEDTSGGGYGGGHGGGGAVGGATIPVPKGVGLATVHGLEMIVENISTVIKSELVYGLAGPVGAPFVQIDRQRTDRTSRDGGGGSSILSTIGNTLACIGGTALAIGSGSGWGIGVAMAGCAGVSSDLFQVGTWLGDLLYDYVTTTAEFDDGVCCPGLPFVDP